jgi:hypothetical protein
VGHFGEEVSGFTVFGANLGRTGDNEKDVFHGESRGRVKGFVGFVRLDLLVSVGASRRE